MRPLAPIGVAWTNYLRHRFNPNPPPDVNSSMKIVYNSDNYCVVEYPPELGYEVVDKHIGRGTYFQGDVATKFRDSMMGILAEDASTERVDEFLDDFGVVSDFPITLH